MQDIEMVLFRFPNPQSSKRFNGVIDRPRPGRPTVATKYEEKILNVLLTFTSQQNEISTFSIYKILKKNQFHPFKVKLVHEFNQDDFDRRIEFCESMMFRIDENPKFSLNIVYSDEATFQLNGNLNIHNCR